MGNEVAYKEEKLANGWFILGVQGQVNRLTADGRRGLSKGGGSRVQGGADSH